MKNAPKVKTSPKDFFMHLLSMILLYASAISFTTIAFQYVNLWLPDPLDQARYYYDTEQIQNTIRIALSFLVVTFPIYVWTVIALKKSYSKDVLKRKIWIRKWLVYFTLFVAALIIIGSLITLIYTFLQGEITLRFIMKLLVILFVTGSIFGYYLWDEKSYEK